MADITIEIQVDVSQLQSLTQANPLSVDYGIGWITILQTGDTGIAHNEPGTNINDPSLYTSTIHVDDIVTWSGVATGVDPSTHIVPIINITNIEFDTEGSFDTPVPIPPPLGVLAGSQMSARASKTTPYENGKYSVISYNIDFTIVYQQRFLDPKIRVQPKPVN